MSTSADRGRRHRRRERVLLSRAPVVVVVEGAPGPPPRRAAKRLPTHWRTLYTALVDAALPARRPDAPPQTR